MRPVVVERCYEGVIDLGRVVVKVKSMVGFLCLDQPDHDLDQPLVRSCCLKKSHYPYLLHYLGYFDPFQVLVGLVL